MTTPYELNGNIDYPSAIRTINRFIEAGIDAVLLHGTTGEGHLATWREQLVFLAAMGHRFGNQVVIIGNASSNNTKESVEFARDCFHMGGVDALLSINPYYATAEKVGVLHHSRAIMDCGLPVMFYNVPGRTGQDFAFDWMSELSNHENFWSVKECAGNDRISQYVTARIPVFSGNDDEAFDAVHRHGAQGVVSVVGNVLPEELVKYILDPRENEEFRRYLPLIKALFKEKNPIPINTLMAMLGNRNPIFKSPLLPANDLLQEEMMGLWTYLKGGKDISFLDLLDTVIL